ncbi:MAG: hypothetical protein JW966_04600 [Anaerolineae bacterium]|nr:hypothetical protein [Anaerolineae bacterium]
MNAQNPGKSGIVPDWVKRLLSSAIIVVGLVSVIVLFIFLAVHAYVSLERTLDDDGERVVYEPAPTLSADVTGADQTPAPPIVADALRILAAAEQAKADAELARRNTEQISDNLSRVLSLLEAVGVLVGFAVGAAVFYGIRNTQETRAEFRAYQQDLDQLGKRLKVYDEPLKNLPDNLAAMNTLKDDLESRLHDIRSTFTDLLQAQQELRLNNYSQAYDLVCGVLERDPDNAQALYIAGWIEFQHIKPVPGEEEPPLERAERRLQQAADLGSPAARAAHGVVKRRLAKHVPLDDKQERLKRLDEARAALVGALQGDNDDLIDLNQESFWGPVAGAYRDMADTTTDSVDRDYFIKKAVESYQKALKVTPRSSYPIGNLAELYLRQDDRDEALQSFQDTLLFAQAELTLVPKDYYHMMDVAMAGMMVTAGIEDDAAREKQIDVSRRDLDRALNMSDLTGEMISISLGGWKRLHMYCPDEWSDIKAALAQAIRVVEEKQRRLNAPPLA